MSNRNMNLDVIVRMKDMLSSPLKRLQNSLKSIANFARGIGIIGASIAAISFMGPIKEAAAFQQQLLDIAGTSNLSGKAAFDFVNVAKGQYEELALLVGQYSADLAGAAGQMIAAGVNKDLVDASLGNIGRAATASGADIADMAAVATSLLQNLKLPADQLNDALGGLVVAGKEGAFELKDMAKYFPQLTGQMAKFGVKGREAVNFLGSALQIARKGTSDPAEAANNLKNFLDKITSTDTIKKFKNMNVDIVGVMQDAAIKGINPIEAVMQKIVKLTGVSGGEIETMMQKARDNGLEGADALEAVREQLVKIHGAGALGSLFADQQVTGFLIPFLSNIDEYKRIKEEVAKATGAMTDEDFETKMKGLNQQLTIFREIGIQAGREVGFAFGTWLPMINENLAAAIKWMRELDKSTGGMVRQALSFAGAAVLVATGLGVLGVVLPIVGAGFSALLALVSPVGLVLAGIAAGAVYIYKNWETYGPRLSRLWKSARHRFFEFAWGIRDRTKQIISAGQDLARRYGPTVRDGLKSAWTDIKGGWTNLKELFKGFAKGLKFDFDMSGLTIDNAKLAAFQALDVALDGIKMGWEALKSFGSGFATHLGQIGENLGSTVNSVGRVGEAFGRLGTAIGKMVGLDSGKLDGIFTSLGKFAGEVVKKPTEILKKFAGAMAWTAEAIADIAEAVADAPDWKSLLPKSVVEMWNDASTEIDKFLARAKALPGQMYDTGIQIGQRMIDGIKSKFDELVAWFGGLPERILDAIGMIDFSSILPEWVVNLLPKGTKTAAAEPVRSQSLLPANSNSMLPATSRDGAVQKFDAGGTIRIVADQGLRVAEATPNNKTVKYAVGNNGRIVGRV